MENETRNSANTRSTRARQRTLTRLAPGTAVREAYSRLRIEMNILDNHRDRRLLCGRADDGDETC